MRWYNDIPIWENTKRINLLIRFKSLVEEYFNNVEFSYMADSPIEKPQASKSRSEINAILDKAHTILIYAGVSPSVYYSPPPAVGGIAANIDLLMNIFNLHPYQVSHRVLLDRIERALGIYNNDKKNSFIRTINPLYWLLRILDYIARLPFVVLGRIGFDQKKLETSLVGKLVKGLFYLIIVFAAFLTVLEKLGYLNWFKSLVITN